MRAREIGLNNDDDPHASLCFLGVPSHSASPGIRSMPLRSSNGPGRVRLLALFAATFVASPALGQSVVRGNLTGVVTELGTGEPLPTVAITVQSVSGASILLETDRSGRFSASLLQAGEYDLLAETLGFRPRLVRGVQLQAGQTATVAIELLAAPPPVDIVDTVFASGGANARFDALASRWVGRGEIAAFPDPLMGLEGLGSLSSVMDESLGSEGLPGSSTAVFWDGVPFTPAQHPASRNGLALPILPRIGIANVDVHRRTDVEWSGGAGGYVAAMSKLAAREAVGEFNASASATALRQSDAFSDVEMPSGASAWGGGAYSFPFPGSNAQVFVGVEGQRSQTPRLSPFSADLAQRLVAVRPPSAGVSAADLIEPFLSTLQAVSGLARLDWSGGEATEVTARVGFSTVSSEGGDYFGPGLDYGSSAPVDAADLMAAVTVLTPVGESGVLEVRAGLERSSRTWGGNASADDPSFVPPTLFGGAGGYLGASPALSGEVSRTAFVGSPIAHVRLSEQHALKLGFSFSIPTYEYRYVDGVSGTFLFDRPEDVTAGQGTFTQSIGSVAAQSFLVPEWGMLFQHQWEPRVGVRITTGLRYDQEKLPVDDVPTLVAFGELTGLVTTDFTADLRKTSPRLAVEFDPSGTGRTVIEGAISATYDQFDPAALNDAIILAGPITVRRQVGGLEQWPATPAGGAGSGTNLPVIAILGPELKAPRTARAAVGLSQSLGGNATLHLMGTIRRTEFLLRRSDANLALAPATLDATDGRPIYGPLRKFGSLVVAEPGSNRRFTAYDAIVGLNSDGWSDYRGFTIAIEHGFEGPLDVFASYTVSSTEDNLVGARVGSFGAQIAPVADTAATSPWEHGTSDFDVPHRFAAGIRATFDLLEGVELSSIYRFRSGWAYTPGYGVGVDVNGDGSGLNDPAFVPEAVRSAGLEAASCLTSEVGGIATRNSCRAPGVHSVDARLSLGLFGVGQFEASLTVEAFNILDADLGLPDTALLLVDEGQSLVQESGTTLIPTRINPAFGEVTQPLQQGRLLRVGFRIGPP